MQNNYRRTPLMLAVLSGFTECVELLLEKGADPNLTDNAKNSALHYATINGYVGTNLFFFSFHFIFSQLFRDN